MARSQPPPPPGATLAARRAGTTVAALAALALGGACASTPPPPRFASALIGGAELPQARLRARKDSPARGAPRDDNARALGVARAPNTATTPTAAAGEPDLGAWGWRPPSAQGERARLLALVGTRDPSAPRQAVLALCRELGGRCPAADSADAGAGASVERDHAPGVPRSVPLSPQTAAALAPGDVLAFGRVGPDNRDDMIALVTGRDARGVLEIFYLAAGVWRRGFVDPLRPRLHRDTAGQIVNTFVRHHRARPPAETRFLAGELLEGLVPADQPSTPERPSRRDIAHEPNAPAATGAR